MSGQNLKTEQHVQIQNLDDVNPRLGKAMMELHSAINNLSQQNKQLGTTHNKEVALKEDMLELVTEKEELFKKIQTLKEKNSKLEKANRQVQSKISEMISTYNQFLEKIS